jgi:hypothetical protein
MKMIRNTFNRFAVTSLCVRRVADEEVADGVGYSVVNSWTVTRVEGQYIAGGETRRLCTIPARPNPIHWVVRRRTIEAVAERVV